MRMRTGPDASVVRRRRAAALGSLGLALVAVGVVGLLASRSGAGDGPRPRAETRPTQSAEGGPSRAPTSLTVRPRWRRSEALGTYADGRLRRGVALPARGREWVSWDPILKHRPNRVWRRWGTDRLVRTTLAVLREFGRDHPAAPRVAIGDLSRPRGGDFGPQFGSIGHASHQNGLDVDIYYPRLDRHVRPPAGPGQVDLRLAQDLVDRFVAAGAERVFVGPSLGLRGPAEVVAPLVDHDNHLHARLPLA